MHSILKLALATIGSAMLGGAAAPSNDGVAIVGATVLPMTKNERLANQTVLVRGDRIIAVGKRAVVRIPPGFRRIDGRGRTLIPGLADMHIHLAPVEGADGDAAQRSLAVMLAHGVTTARGMAGSPANLIVREKIARGEIAGPRLYAASPALSDKSAPTPAAARAAVRDAKAKGYDLIKSHHLTNIATWQAAQDEARRVGIATGGHVTGEVGIDRAIAARQQIEHLDGLLAPLLDATHPASKIAFGQIPPPSVLDALMSVPQARFDALATRLKAARSWHVPTLALFDKISDVETPTATLERDPSLQFVPEAAVAQWRAQRDEMMKSGMFTHAQAQRFRALRRQLVAAMARKGVPMMAGSDTAQAFHIWGPGLIDEVEALHHAGLSRMAALRSATVVPRDYLRSLPGQGSATGQAADFGTIERGARADLLLLTGDPTADLDTLRRPEMVIAAGQVYDRAALDAMLVAAAAAARPAKAAWTGPAHVYVMRHLQKGSGDDPPLSEQGARLADLLANQLAGAGLKAIFATPTRRATLTGAPLARRLGLEVTPYDPRDAAALVAAARKVDGNVLIVGHSNTVPDLVAAFGGQRPPPMSDADYGAVYQIAPATGLTRTLSVGLMPTPALTGGGSRR